MSVVNPNQSSIQGIQDWLTANPSPKDKNGLLRIVDTGTTRKIEYLSLSDKNIFEKGWIYLLHFLGFGGTQLSKIAQFLSENEAIRKATPGAMTRLQDKISHYNSKGLRSRLGHTIAANLLIGTTATNILGTKSTPVFTNKLNSLKKCAIKAPEFSSINSSQLQKSQVSGVKGDHTDRALFLNDKNYKTTPPVISKSEFVPDSFAHHLMRDKSDTAIAEKHNQGRITNMDGALHTFLTPLCSIKMSGDYQFDLSTHSHKAISLEGQVRSVVLSAAIHPDFELPGKDEVVMRLVEVKQSQVEGKELPKNFSPYSEGVDIKKYDQTLLEHMVYHLTEDHRLPSKNEIKNPILNKNDGLKLINSLIGQKNINIGASLKNSFIDLQGHTISLEALFNIYLHQIRNEMSGLEALLPQGYVYTIDPPSIFAATIGTANVDILNRMQILAFQQLKPESFKNLKKIGFNDYSDKEAVGLYRKVFTNTSGVEICSKASLFQANGKYSEKSPYALVIHNNSDAFGQNIENEPSGGSIDGAIGCYSDAACCLKRSRKDLVSRVT